MQKSSVAHYACIRLKLHFQRTKAPFIETKLAKNWKFPLN